MSLKIGIPGIPIHIVFGNGNGKHKCEGFVSREDCHKAQEEIKGHLNDQMDSLKVDLKDYFNTRFEDWKAYWLENRKK